MRKHSEVLFITMPSATPIHPSIALGLLSSILSESDLASSTLYGNLMMPRPVETSVYAIEDPGYYEDRTAGLAFVPHLYSETDTADLGSAVADRYMQLITREGHLSFDKRTWDWRSDDNLRALLMRQTMEDIGRARCCLDRCLHYIADLDFDIAGFSLTFETQLIASLALARLIKKYWPERKVIFGGSACTAIQGVTMLKSFDYIDVVSLGEADHAIVPLILGLRGAGMLNPIPGIAYREGLEIVVTGRPEPSSSLDLLPVPNYAPYFEQKRISEWRDTITVPLFETSRGCWWGEKHLCSFCGLNGETLTYRAKSAGRVMQEIRYFRNHWPLENGLQAVDNILPTRYFADLLPILAQEQKQHPVPLFFEVKANLKRTQIFQLAAAGFSTLQPGIESFSDHILTLMDKGASGLQQVCCIKWGQEAGISITYNILLRNPGETREDYEEMLELMPFIKHLLPPYGIANMQLERYSPYFMRPEEFGIKNVRPKAHYYQMFPEVGIDLPSLVYQFDFDHDELDRPALVESRRKFIEAVLEWQANFKPHQLDYTVSENKLLIFDARNGREQCRALHGLQGEIYRWMEEPRSFRSLCSRFPDLSTTVLRFFLESLVERKLVIHHRSDKYLAVAVRAYATRTEYLAEMDRALEAGRSAAPKELPVLRG